MGRRLPGCNFARLGLPAVRYHVFGVSAAASALPPHRKYLYTKGSHDRSIPQAAVLRVLEQENALLPPAVVLRGRVRCLTDGAIFGTKDFGG
ncbi:MAG: hypothetical protein ACI81V_001217 [Lentimonas sp.]|jgi:hypothetical protein